MKVSFIWRLAFALVLGFSLGVFVTSRTFIKNIPPSIEISIGKVKIRGQGNVIENIMDIEDVTTDGSETKNKRKRFRRKR